jgi:hypothetical protein
MVREPAAIRRRAVSRSARPGRRASRANSPGAWNRRAQRRPPRPHGTLVPLRESLFVPGHSPEPLACFSRQIASAARSAKKRHVVHRLLRWRPYDAIDRRARRFPPAVFDDSTRAVASPGAAPCCGPPDRSPHPHRRRTDRRHSRLDLILQPGDHVAFAVHLGPEAYPRHFGGIHLLLGPDVPSSWRTSCSLGNCVVTTAA